MEKLELVDKGVLVGFSEQEDVGIEFFNLTLIVGIG